MLPQRRQLLPHSRQSLLGNVQCRPQLHALVGICVGKDGPRETRRVWPRQRVVPARLHPSTGSPPRQCCVRLGKLACQLRFLRSKGSVACLVGLHCSSDALHMCCQLRELLSGCVALDAQLLSSRLLCCGRISGAGLSQLQLFTGQSQLLFCKDAALLCLAKRAGCASSGLHGKCGFMLRSVECVLQLLGGGPPACTLQPLRGTAV